MRPIGFSTGALAKGDFAHGLALQRGLTAAVELSALRDHELPALGDAVPSLDLGAFAFVSVHAPSKLQSMDEARAFELLARLPQEWPVIAHPELLRTLSLWRTLGARLCIENMDGRKSAGRTAAELRALFDAFPDATFCLDLGHARQIDPTMAEAMAMLRAFGERLVQLHVSDVGERGEHRALSDDAIEAFARITALVPQATPVIIEAVLEPEAIEQELERVARWVNR